MQGLEAQEIIPLTGKKVQSVVLSISEEDENAIKYWYILCYM